MQVFWIWAYLGLYEVWVWLFWFGRRIVGGWILEKWLSAMNKISVWGMGSWRKDRKKKQKKSVHIYRMKWMEIDWLTNRWMIVCYLVNFDNCYSFTKVFNSYITDGQWHSFCESQYLCFSCWKYERSVYYQFMVKY
jgi:hypothetical protein